MDRYECWEVGTIAKEEDLQSTENTNNWEKKNKIQHAREEGTASLKPEEVKHVVSDATDNRSITHYWKPKNSRKWNIKSWHWWRQWENLNESKDDL